MANEYLKRFKELFSSGDSKFKLAARYHFFLTFSFTDTIDGLFQGISWQDDIGYLVQKLDVPNFVLRDVQSVEDLTVKNPVGAYRIIDNATFLPETNEFSITFLDTELPIFESLFFPWMKAVSTSQQPDANKQFSNSKERYPRALIRIHIFDNTNQIEILSYEISGAFPIHVDTPTLSYSAADNSTTRTVVFAFNEIKLILKQQTVFDISIANEYVKAGNRARQAKQQRQKEDAELYKQRRLQEQKLKAEQPEFNGLNPAVQSGLTQQELQHMQNSTTASLRGQRTTGSFGRNIFDSKKLKPETIVARNIASQAVNFGLNAAPSAINPATRAGAKNIAVNQGINDANSLLRKTISDLQNNASKK